MDGRPNRRNKAAFSSSSGVVLTGPLKPVTENTLHVFTLRIFC